MAFASLTIDLNARLANIERDMGRAAQVAERNSQRMQAAFGKVSAAAASIGAALGVGSFAAFIKGSIDAADNLNDLSKKTGLAVEDLAGLQLVVDKSGTSMEMLGNGIGKLNKYMGEAAQGNQEAQRTLKALGITASDPMEAFLQLADAFGKFRTEGDRAAVMSKVVGKNWGELAPALAEGSAGLRAMIEDGKRLNPITKEMAEQADRFNDALSRFKTQMAGVGTSIANDLLPPLNKMAEQLSEGIRIFGGFGSALLNLGLISPFQNITDGLAQYRAEVKRLQDLQSGSRPEIAAMLEPQIQAATKKLEYLRFLQRQEALALNDKYGTGNYKQPAAQGQTIQTSAFSTPSSAKPDPLASLLGQTETAQLAEYDKMLALIEARYKANKLSADQYAEVLLILNDRLDKNLGVGNTASIDAAQKAAIEENSAAFNLMMEVNDANIAQAEQAAAVLGALKAEYIDLIDPVEKYRQKLEDIDKLESLGGPLGLSPDQATAARLIINEQIDALNTLGEANKQTVDFMQSVWDSAAKNMETSLADFLFDPFKDGLNGMLLGFVNMIKRMAAEALAANIMQSLFGQKNASGGYNLGGGSLGSFVSSIGKFFGFADGGYHSGGLRLVGERGPELEATGPARIYNAQQTRRMLSGAQAAPSNIRIINAFDHAVVGDYMGSAAGERVIMNVVRRNANVFRSLVQA